MINDKVEISFFGGEPMLQVSNILKIINNINVKNIQFSITTNLCYEITDEVRAVLNACETVCTSWDPFFIRFKSAEKFDLWRRNCEDVRPNYVNITLTKELLQYSPRFFLESCTVWRFDKVFFTCLNAEGKALQYMKFPDWNEVDNWLCDLYSICPPWFKVNFFENFKKSYNQENDLWYKIGKYHDLVINPDGSILINSKQLSIFDELNNLELYYSKKDVKEGMHSSCRICDLYSHCNINVKWLGDVCPFPKKLFRKIMYEKS